MLVVKKDTRSIVLRLENAMLALPSSAQLDDAGLVRHFFGPGVYGRELRLPAGALIVGKLHKAEHIAMLHAGRVLVFSDAGLEELVAPCQFVSPAGTKRVIFAVEESVWTTYHDNPDDGQDLSQLEQRLIATDYKELEYELDGSGEHGAQHGDRSDWRRQGAGAIEHCSPERPASARP